MRISTSDQFSGVVPVDLGASIRPLTASPTFP
jgi:hypothetical protein